QLLRRQDAELIVDQRQELLSRVGIAPLDRREDVGRVRHRYARSLWTAPLGFTSASAASMGDLAPDGPAACLGVDRVARPTIYRAPSVESIPCCHRTSVGQAFQPDGSSMSGGRP